MKPLILGHYMLCMVGQPYRWGGDDTVDGFDCSGLAIEILRARGLLPRSGDWSAQALYDVFKAAKAADVTTSNGDLGDLAFYGVVLGQITHIGTVIDPGYVLEAGGGGSKTKTKADAAAQNAFVRIRPIRYRADIVAILRP